MVSDGSTYKDNKAAEDGIGNVGRVDIELRRR